MYVHIENISISPHLLICGWTSWPGMPHHKDDIQAATYAAVGPRTEMPFKSDEKSGKVGRSFPDFDF